MKRAIVVLGLVALGFSLFVTGRQLAEEDFDPSAPIKFGEIFTEHNEYARSLLGDIVVAPFAGHDGKYFFTQAMDPFYLEPEVHATFLDRPSYRAQRMAYPALASLGGLSSPNATAWGLIVVNVVAMVVGTIYTGLVATRMGHTWLLGLAFLFNPGLIADLTIDGAGVLAMAAMMAGVYYAIDGKLWAATAALSVASLARETMLIAVVGLAAFLWYRRRRFPWQLAIPVVAVASWWFYVHERLQEGLAQDVQALGLPFVGFAEAFAVWTSPSGDLVDLVLGCFLLIASFIVVIKSIRTPSALGWATSGFALLGMMLSEPVWLNWFDSSRALAPVVTAFVILVASDSDGSTESVSSRRVDENVGVT